RPPARTLRQDRRPVAPDRGAQPGPQGQPRRRASERGEGMSDAAVYIVDDDEAIRDSLAIFLQSAGFTTRTWPDADAFLADYDTDKGGCLLLDIRMPAKSGLGLQQDLTAVGSSLPIIFITGHADVDSAVRALKAGAFDFIEKPFDNTRLLEL